MPSLFVLTRRTPVGVEKDQGPFLTRRDAAVASGHVLADNARVPKAEAQRFSKSLERKPLDSWWVHTGSGYQFRIQEVSE